MSNAQNGNKLPENWRWFGLVGTEGLGTGGRQLRVALLSSWLPCVPGNHPKLLVKEAWCVIREVAKVGRRGGRFLEKPDLCLLEKTVVMVS